MDPSGARAAALHRRGAREKSRVKTQNLKGRFAPRGTFRVAQTQIKKAAPSKRLSELQTHKCAFYHKVSTRRQTTSCSVEQSTSGVFISNAAHGGIWNPKKTSLRFYSTKRFDTRRTDHKLSCSKILQTNGDLNPRANVVQDRARRRFFIHSFILVTRSSAWGEFAFPRGRSVASTYL